MANFIAVIHKDPNSDFGVSFPDFPGCVSAGSTLDEAKDMAQEALALHIDGMREDEETIPTPSDFEALVEDPEYCDAVAFLIVSVPHLKAKAVRINITIPEDTLRKIDTVAKRKGMSRSSFLVHAAKSAMKSAHTAKPDKARSTSG